MKSLLSLFSCTKRDRRNQALRLRRKLASSCPEVMSPNFYSYSSSFRSHLNLHTQPFPALLLPLHYFLLLQRTRKSSSFVHRRLLHSPLLHCRTQNRRHRKRTIYTHRLAMFYTESSFRSRALRNFERNCRGIRCTDRSPRKQTTAPTRTPLQEQKRRG